MSRGQKGRAHTQTTTHMWIIIPVGLEACAMGSHVLGPGASMVLAALPAGSANTDQRQSPVLSTKWVMPRSIAMGPFPRGPQVAGHTCTLVPTSQGELAVPS